MALTPPLGLPTTVPGSFGSVLNEISCIKNNLLKQAAIQQVARMSQIFKHLGECIALPPNGNFRYSPVGMEGWDMSKLQSFAMAMVLAALGVAALLQIIQVDHVLRMASIGALGTVSILAAMVFFLFAFRGRD
jgi:hypothetical protein